MKKTGMSFLTPKVIIAITVLVAWSAACFFVCWGAKKQVSRLRSELAEVESQIRQVERIMHEGETISQGVFLLEERARVCDARFPQKEMDGLDLLSDLARKLGIEIISLQSQPKTLYLEKNNQKVELDGKTGYQLSVSMTLRASYREVIKYLGELKGCMPAFHTIEKLRMIRDLPGTTKLNVTLELKFYLLS